MADTPGDRNLSLDWHRGIAVLAMLEVHVVNGWGTTGLRLSTAGEILRWIGGLAAPGFLFLAGVSSALADAKAARRGVPVASRRRAALRRALWLLGVAFAFRGLEFITGFAFWAEDGFRGLLRVDVLNVIAVSLGLGALTTLGLSGRFRLGVALGMVGLAAIATVHLAPSLRDQNPVFDYLALDGRYVTFSLLPWVGFFYAGVASTSLLEAKAASTWAIPVRVAGAAVASWLVFFLFHHLGTPAGVEARAWNIGLSLFERTAFQLGLLALVSAPLLAGLRLPWLVRFGRHSLFAYVLSVDLTYGYWTHWLHGVSGWLVVALGVLGATVIAAWACAMLDQRAERKRLGTRAPT